MRLDDKAHEIIKHEVASQLGSEAMFVFLAVVLMIVSEAVILIYLSSRVVP